MTATNQKNKTENKTENDEIEGADFETAMDATGFGFFNVILLTTMTFASIGGIFESTSMSYILPVAECDLKLTLFDKGVLNACSYAGMITSALIWGYLSDTQGRRKLLLYGFLVDSVCVLCSGLSQNFISLVLFKFLGGFIVNGPVAIFFTYLTEMHSTKYRSRIVMLQGMCISVAGLLMPLLAWAIFPQHMELTIFNGLRIHSWNVFLLVCAIPSFVAALLLIAMPESPKFLMSHGRNAEALLAFQKMYALNTRKPAHTYPIKVLVEEVASRDGNANEVVFTIENVKNGDSKNVPKRVHRSFSQALSEGIEQMKPLFRKPLLGRAFHVYVLQFCSLLSLNTIRLWLPQLFASSAEYEALESTTSSNICAVLEFSINQTAAAVTNYGSQCLERKEISIDMYVNNILVSGVGFIGYMFAGIIVRAVGQKSILTYGLIITGTLGLSLYWSSSSLTTVIISAAFVTVACVATSALITTVVTIFPTVFRSIIICSVMMFGRLGALSGNMLFPILIQLGCLPPFLMVGILGICAGILSLFLANPKNITFS